MHFFGHQVLVFNLPQRETNKQTNPDQTGLLLFKKQVAGALSEYILLHVLASVDLDTGKKRTGDFYELLCL